MDPEKVQEIDNVHMHDLQFVQQSQQALEPKANLLFIFITQQF